MSTAIVIILIWELIRWVFTKRWCQGQLVLATLYNPGQEDEKSFVLQDLDLRFITYFVKTGSKEGLCRRDTYGESDLGVETDYDKALEIEWTPGGEWKQGKHGKMLWYSRSISSVIAGMLKETLCDTKKGLAKWVKEDC